MRQRWWPAQVPAENQDAREVEKRAAGALRRVQRRAPPLREAQVVCDAEPKVVYALADQHLAEPAAARRERGDLRAPVPPLKQLHSESVRAAKRRAIGGGRGGEPVRLHDELRPWALLIVLRGAVEGAERDLHSGDSGLVDGEIGKVEAAGGAVMRWRPPEGREAVEIFLHDVLGDIARVGPRRGSPAPPRCGYMRAGRIALAAVGKALLVAGRDAQRPQVAVQHERDEGSVRQCPAPGPGWALAAASPSAAALPKE